MHDYLTYLASLGRSERGLKTYSERLRYFRDFAAQKKVKALHEVSTKLVEAYADSLLQRSLKRNSITSYMRTVSQFLAWAYKRGLTLTRLDDAIELPKEEEALPPTPLTVEDVQALLALLTGRRITAKRNRAIVETMYACGLRLAEVVGMNIGDVDFDAQTVLVHGKGQKDRLLPIHDEALAAMADYLTQRGGKPRRSSPLFILHYRKGQRRIRNGDIQALFRRLNKRFEKHLHPHLIRHTFAVHMLRGGADLRYVQALLGHESPDTTSRYLGLVKEELKAEYDRAVADLS